MPDLISQHNKEIALSFPEDTIVELKSHGYSHVPELQLGRLGKVLISNFSNEGVDLWIDFNGYKTWIDVQDVQIPKQDYFERRKLCSLEHT